MIAQTVKRLVAVMRADLARDGVIVRPDPIGIPIGVSGQTGPVDSIAAMIAETGRSTFRVWDGASDRTVFGAPEANYVFRAWHDVYGHVLTGADTSYHGEAETVRVHLARFPGRRNVDLRALVRAEGWGQIVHHARHGTFPVNQAGFTVACLNMGIERAAAQDWSASGR